MAEDAAARLFQAFVNQDPAAAISVIEKVRKAGIAQESMFDSLFAPAMSLLGGAWASGEIDEVTFTQAAVVAEQITSFVASPSTSQDTGITILVGTMHRDYHAIDKSIIGAALKDAGHRVIDLGVDVRPSEFLERVEESGARIVVVCASMIASARDAGRVREAFASAGIDDIVVLVSGGPYTADPALARRVGANGVIRGAESALRLVGRIARERLAVG